MVTQWARRGRQGQDWAFEWLKGAMGPFQVCSDPDDHLNTHPETSGQVKSAFQPPQSVPRCALVYHSVSAAIPSSTEAHAVLKPVQTVTEASVSCIDSQEKG